MLIHVPLSQIDDNPFQQRQEYGDIAELAADILRHKTTRPDTLGLQQVPTARLVGDDGDLVPASGLDREDWLTDGGQLLPGWRVQLEFGHRRKRAFAYLASNGTYEFAKMPLNILDLSDDDMLDGVWSENAKRKNISAVEEAELIRLKLARLGPGATHADIGAEWGLSRPVITNRLGLLELPDSVKQANRDGRVSERLALALKPVLRIGELTKGSGVSWGSKVGEQWGPPASPEKYIEYVVANPDKVTSDDVREFAKRLTRHAGEELPGWLGKEKIDGAGIEQPQCKGCSFRIDQSCLRPSCMKAKLKAWPDIALEAFSQESDIPTSDRKADFEPFTNDMKLRQRLKDLYAAGETGDGMVCGWWVGEGAARPFGEKSGDYVWNVASEKDGRCGIALGYRGNLPAAVLAGDEPGQPVYEMPDPDDVEIWGSEAEDIATAARKAMIAALADGLQHQVAEWDILQALIISPDKEWIDSGNKLAKEVAKFLVDRGQGVGYVYQHYDAVQMFRATVKRAGLAVNVLGSVEDEAEKTAVLILAHWYNSHRSYSWERYGHETLERITAWEQLSGAATSPMAEHIARAKRHIEQKTAAEGEAAKRAEHEREEQETAVANDEAICAGCQDVLWVKDAITCSCGDVLCEDCYVEQEHVFHDEGRDPIFDDLIAQRQAATAVPDEAPTNNNPAIAWLRSYVDDSGRTWRDLEPNQTHHANSPCFQAFTRAFPDEAEPKWQLKQARAILEREAAVAEEVRV